MGIFRIHTLILSQLQARVLHRIILLGCYYGAGRHLEVLLPSIRPCATPRRAPRDPPDAGLLPLRLANAGAHQGNTSFNIC